MAPADVASVKRTIDWSAAVWSGIIAGLVFMALE